MRKFSVYQIAAVVSTVCLLVIAGGGLIKNITSKKGNKCPEGYAYMGQGICNIVKCEVEKHEFSNFFTKDDELLEGKSNWKCKYHAWWGPRRLRVGNASVPIGNDPNCPSGVPSIGWNSTCEAPYVKVKKKNKKPMACKNGVWDKNHPKCRDEGITSPMDMD